MDCGKDYKRVGDVRGVCSRATSLSHLLNENVFWFKTSGEGAADFSLHSACATLTGGRVGDADDMCKTAMTYRDTLVQRLAENAPQELE